LHRNTQSLGFDRQTIRKYVALAQQVGVARGEPFPAETELVRRLREVSTSQLLRERPAQDLLTPHGQWMAELIKEKEMTAKQVWRLLLEEKDLRVSYCTVKRHLRSRFQFGAPPVTVRLEVEPGSQAQVDFGYAGLMVNSETGRRRRAWAFVMTLSFSRHRFVRFVFRQDVATWSSVSHVAPLGLKFHCWRTISRYDCPPSGDQRSTYSWVRSVTRSTTCSQIRRSRCGCSKRSRIVCPPGPAARHPEPSPGSKADSIGYAASSEVSSICARRSRFNQSPCGGVGSV
jgi:hypothetical protein